MRGNWALLVVTGAALLSVTTLAMGAHLYRWESIVWSSMTALNSLLAYFYSRQVD